ncbi:MAG: hypothetical protein HN617_02180, partial [Planctomycetaceae bacterium]|nr:hypothetical protein [Planctomycetaceae bacterium]
IIIGTLTPFEERVLQLQKAVASSKEWRRERVLALGVVLLGKIEVRGGKVVLFDMVADGSFWGQGPYSGIAPKGRFPLAVGFRLADGTDAADQIPPQASRGWVQGYIR